MGFEFFIYLDISVGLLLSLYNLVLIVRAKSTENWDRTDGTITDSELVDCTSIGETDSTFKPKVEYSYALNGNEYKSKRIYFGSHIMTSYNKRHCQKLVEKYPKGTKVIVYFDRANEKQSVLETGIKYQIIFGFILGLIITGIGLTFLINPNIVSSI
jgi:hypothetical protein